MIFDCFTFFNELDVLEARLNELHNVVDRFVIVEATETFQGKSKPLYFSDNRDRFKAFDDKITHIVVEFPSRNLMTAVCTNPSDENWAREHYQRDQISRGLIEAKPDDLIIVSDVDEIIKAEALTAAISSRSKNELTIFLMAIFFGTAAHRNPNGVWQKGSRMIAYRQFTGAQRLRRTRLSASRSFGSGTLGRLHTRLWNWQNTGIGGPIRTVENAGWHFTSMGDWQAYRTKISAYSHSEFLSGELFKDQSKFAERLQNLSRNVSLLELPLFIQKNPERFGFAKLEASDGGIQTT
jgi:beta-1,4-mannosyl-glycoprotein beta-1,4-N-acetylglucosaminyltransferase